jgi:hypothetical protein
VTVQEPTFGGDHEGVVWPAGYTSGTKPNGKHVVVTADGREIAAGDTVTAGGGIGDAAQRMRSASFPSPWRLARQGASERVRQVHVIAARLTIR